MVDSVERVVFYCFKCLRAEREYCAIATILYSVIWVISFGVRFLMGLLWVCCLVASGLLRFGRVWFFGCGVCWRCFGFVVLFVDCTSWGVSLVDVVPYYTCAFLGVMMV